ncbi:hypothetical protein D3C87_1240180 [compost metagenome]
MHDEEAQGVVRLVGRDQQGLGLPLDRETIAHVQTAGLARRNPAQARARQIKDLQPAQPRRRHQTMMAGVGAQHDHAAARLAGRSRINRCGHSRDGRVLSQGGAADRHRQHHGADPKKIARQPVGHGRLPHIPRRACAKGPVEAFCKKYATALLGRLCVMMA